MTAIPRHAAPDRLSESLLGVAAGIDAEVFVELPSPVASFLPHAIACVLLEADAAAASERIERMLGAPAREGFSDVPAGVLSFVEYCAFTPIVPVEESEMSPKVLAEIVGVGGAVGLATLAGAPVVIAVAAAGGTVVVLGAALGLAQRLYGWIAP